MTTERVESTTKDKHADEINVKVAYLPAAHPFHDRYDEDTVAEVVRAAAMAFFGVADRQERDTYKYFLELDGVRIDTSETLEHLVQEQHHGRELHFNLVEEITPGAE